MGQGVYKRCGCRNPKTGRQLGYRCPKLDQRGHGSWSFCLDLPGDGRKRRQIRRSGFRTRQAALDAREFLAHPHDVERASEIVTVGEWLLWWIEHLENLQDTTLAGYRSHLRLYLIPLLGKHLLRELTGVQVQSAFTAIVRTRRAAGHPMATGTLRRIHSTLRNALNFARSMGLIEDNPAARVRLPKGTRPHAVVWTRPMVAWWQATGQRPAVAVWTVAQSVRFLRWVRTAHPLAALFHLVLMLGLRRGEAVGVQWSDVDFQARLLVISRQVRRSPAGRPEIARPKTAAGNRVLPLDRVTAAVLYRLRAKRMKDNGGVEPTGYLFPGRSGGPLHPDAVSRLFRELNTASGLPPVRLHDLRHGAASLSLAAGNDLKYTQALLGHKSIVLTADTYVSVLEEHAHRGARATAELILKTEYELSHRLRHRGRRPAKRSRGKAGPARLRRRRGYGRPQP